MGNMITTTLVTVPDSICFDGQKQNAFDRWQHFYYNRRLHGSLSNHTPNQIWKEHEQKQELGKEPRIKNHAYALSTNGDRKSLKIEESRLVDKISGVLRSLSLKTRKYATVKLFLEISPVNTGLVHERFYRNQKDRNRQTIAQCNAAGSGQSVQPVQQLQQLTYRRQFIVYHQARTWFPDGRLHQFLFGRLGDGTRLRDGSQQALAGFRATIPLKVL